jgi:hypothetical protein
VPCDRLGGWGAALTEPLELELELELELDFDFDVEPDAVVEVVAGEPLAGAVAADTPSSPEPEVSVVVLAADGGCGRASSRAKSPVAPAATRAVQRVMRETRPRCRSRCRGEVFTPPLNPPKLRI